MPDAILGAIVGGSIGIVGSIVGQYIAYRNNQLLAKQARREAERANLDSLVLKMIELSIQHPILEKQTYITAYPNCSGHENGKEKYENYCCFVFNLLSRIYTFFNGNREKIEEYIHIREIVGNHCAWWQHDRDNLAYDEPFRQYVQSIIDDRRRRE